MARWTLDHNGIPYVEECHAPVFNVLATRKYSGGSIVPQMDTGEAALPDARAIVDYYEARAPMHLQLYPADSTAQAEARQLFDFFHDKFGVSVRAWAYAYMLPAAQRDRIGTKIIPAESRIFVATLSAMFDGKAFANPKEFNGRRDAEYLHFGYGLHACLGRAINGVQIPELVAALLRLPALRRAPGTAGQVVYDGPFPDRLILAFDA